MVVTKNITFPRILPFALYMAFIGIEELLRYLTSKGMVNVSTDDLLYLYPIKIAVVGLSLIVLWPRYDELKALDLSRIPHTAASVLIGIVVFVLWINMDWAFATFGTLQGYNPLTIGDDTLRNVLIGSRLLGAVIVVPIMEELFWRSFLIRYVIRPEFSEVPIGRFTWLSFLVITVLFGLEHNLWLAGMMAGAAYNILLYYTKSIAQCIIAHAVTNLALGIYVLQSGQWKFW
ncbi:MAG: CAAX prenyl protease-related protein [Nitrospirota bacterium]